ncbi:M20 aminoacylase family protein [Tatumella saanichensis]|uniref:M20 aminoacylase family protein n=1 Tax=Tatumella saanichensis TaxID=480813 RepID=UPI0004A4EC55|nr:M20 aminoacylase family protein [Tatumella saanichensis]
MDYQKWIEIRHQIHQHPETGFKEQRTAALVADLLTGMGLEVVQNIGKTGVVGILHGKHGAGRMIGLRADIDALPMKDEGQSAWASCHAGAAHACGHDGHTTMLLAAAEQLSLNPDFAGTVCFIFQPAEEGLAGAKAMIDDGLFSRFPCDAVYAIHNWPELPLGEFRTRSGPIMAAADRFDITLSGGGGHAAQPHLSADTLLATSELVMALNTLVPRKLNPHESALLTVTQIHGGSSHNMIPGEASITGTVRTFTPEARDTLEQQLRLKTEHICAAYGLKAQINYNRYYPATCNTAREAELALRAAHQAGLKAQAAEHPALTSEDFSFMLLEKPGAYVWLGAGPSHPLHHPCFDFNDEAIPYGVRWFCEIVRQELGEI